MLNLEPKPASDPIMQQARRYLVARKRATLLAELLQARMTLREARENLCDPSAYPAVVTREPIVIALQTILDTLKSRYAGINLMEVSTCGAIAPYNHILGGKLAALLLFSPEIADDYRRLYSGPSIIASQLKNAEVRRDVALRFLRYLKRQGTASEPTLRQALGLAHQRDFVEVAEYLMRLGLIETSSAGRRLTRAGDSYLRAPVPPDLRSRIARGG